MLLFDVHASRLADTLFYSKSRREITMPAGLREREIYNALASQQVTYRGMIRIASKTNKVVSSKQTLEQTLKEFYSRWRLQCVGTFSCACHIWFSKLDAPAKLHSIDKHMV